MHSTIIYMSVFVANVCSIYEQTDVRCVIKAYLYNSFNKYLQKRTRMQDNLWLCRGFFNVATSHISQWFVCVVAIAPALLS